MKGSISKLNAEVHDLKGLIRR